MTLNPLEQLNVRRQFQYPTATGSTTLTGVVFGILALTSIELTTIKAGAIATLCTATGFVFTRLARWWRSDGPERFSKRLRQLKS